MTTRLQFKSPLVAGFVAFIAAGGIGTARVGTAALLLQQSAMPLPHGDLVQYTISAVGTAGEFINVFTAPSIRPATANDLGIHNVWSPLQGLPHMPPVAQQHVSSARPPDPGWAAYDTHFLFESSQMLELGAPFTETNDGSTTGTLELNHAFGKDPISGFGTFESHEWSTKGVLRDFGGSKVDFMQVVMRAGDLAHFSLDIVALTDPTTAIKQQFSDYVIGIPDEQLWEPERSRVFDPQPLPVNPEPPASPPVAEQPAPPPPPAPELPEPPAPELPQPPSVPSPADDPPPDNPFTIDVPPPPYEPPAIIRPGVDLIEIEPVAWLPAGHEQPGFYPHSIDVTSSGFIVFRTETTDASEFRLRSFHDGDTAPAALALAGGASAAALQAGVPEPAAALLAGMALLALPAFARGRSSR